MENRASIVEPTAPHPLDASPRQAAESVIIPSRPRLSPAEAQALVDHVQGFFSGQPSLEDEYFRDREADTW